MKSIMDIEKLNKSQIVMLTLLISFVTSIATGIVTVSLMEQAPPVIPQTINRVVERTVERVVPKETQTATVITTEKTVMVKETELISQAVARVRASAVRLHEWSVGDEAKDFVTRGFVIADSYVVAALSNAKVDDNYLVPVGETSLLAKVLKADSSNGLALLVLTETKGSHIPAAVVGTGAVTLGQNLIALTGSNSLKVASGIVTSINEDGAGSKESTQSSFETNIDDSMLVMGSVLLNTDGAVIGMYSGSKNIVASTHLTALVKSIKTEGQVAGTTTPKSI
jgi:hypothetical protein